MFIRFEKRNVYIITIYKATIIILHMLVKIYINYIYTFLSFSLKVLKLRLTSKNICLIIF